jgi:hypothetical protein
MRTHIGVELLGDSCERMRLRTKDYRAAFPEWDSEDRLIALEEVRMLLKSRLVNVDSMLDILFKS